MIDFPQQFIERMQEMLGDEYEDFVASYDKSFHNGLRVNTLKTDAKQLFEQMGLEETPLGVPWNEDGFYLEQKKRFSKHPFYHGGLYYIQEASAMLPARLVHAQPGERILDMCAAPGGKSTAIGAALKGEGLLVSNDISRSRAKALLRNLEGFGITNMVVTSEYPEKLSRYFEGFFDKVLIDAPCSGEGMFHKEPSMTQSWLKMGPEEYHRLQKDILSYGAKMLRSGGQLIYSTCTFSPEEDEGSIAWFLQEHPDFHVVPIDESILPAGCECIDRGNPSWGDGNQELANTLRLWPHHLEGEGHFAALLQKDGEKDADCVGTVPKQEKRKNKSYGQVSVGGRKNNQQAVATGRKSKDEMRYFESYLDAEGIHYPFDKSRLEVSGGYVQYQPESLPDLKGMHIMRSGWFLGEIKKNRFEPSGAFARGLTAKDCEKVLHYAADSTEVIKYLKCETMEVSTELCDGWYLICVEDYPLGWGKVIKGTLKNKYPSGWRLQ